MFLARFGKRSAIVDGFATRACACRVATLENEAGNQSVEDRVIVVAIYAVLEEVAACEGDLLRPELERDIARGSMKDAGGSGLGFEIVEGGHLADVERTNN